MSSDDVPNTNVELFQRWSRLMAGAGMTVKDVGNGLLEMVAEIEFERCTDARAVFRSARVGGGGG